VLGFGLAAVALLLIPFLDRRGDRGGSGRVVTWFGVAIIAFIIVLTYLGYTADPTQ
jgi:quinol-cytochrome oxidoreductase complex cytochrome b subunit